MNELKKLKGFEYFLAAFKKYADYAGRSTRSEFWYFILYDLIVRILLSIVELMAIIADRLLWDKAPFLNYSAKTLQIIYLLVAFFACLALLWRRLHDTNRSGFWAGGALTSFILIFIFTFFVGETKIDYLPFVTGSFFLLFVISLVVFIIFCILLLIFCCQKSNPYRNDFGYPPETILLPPDLGISENLLDNFDKIEKLAELRDKRILTEEEFQQAKSKFLR